MDIVLFTAIIIVASVLQTSTGFGFSILATPFLLLLFEPREAIQINLILSLFISLALIRKIYKDIDFGIVQRFTISSAAGLPIGMAVFLWIDIVKLKLGVSVIILLLTVLLIFKLRLTRTKKRDLGAGGISGMLTTSIGMPGPPLLLYFSGTETKKETLRATTLAFYLFIYLVSLLIQVTFAGTSATIWLWSAFALPLVFAGMYAGQLLFRWISPGLFRLFTYVILLFTGLYLLVENL
ncbi:sulfite exporter TauE/SafE family protein [Halobacillus sp. A5]|uniref:sulfite exporter TauE/SafE family protein n=1 Tax=Halobacillus sp. A5 TaxID=2880263 RepID=UPI0020A631AB|nr:sulfite exporter TauE/SafE family protein [Halobacillus sp. A5]MCP3027161.1 sulfite exporter TauE/SafE family protein [Halobacillus sp. A5]